MSITTVGSLRQGWRHVIAGDGGDCPVCDRWGKIYKRTLNKTMAKSLIWLCQEVKRTGYDWIDVPNTGPRFVIRSNQLPILTTWGLVERCAKDGDEGGAKHSGLWRPTDKGWSFYYNRIRVPKHAFAYNNHVLKYGDEMVHLYDCFKTMFDYNEVMASRFDDY